MLEALERVELDKLLKKLNDSKVPPFITSIVEIFLTNSFVVVQFNGATSKIWRRTKGVRQGEVLSAQLFCVYMEAILERVAA